LAGLLEESSRRFGFCALIDCHSMPATGGPNDTDSGVDRVDFVLGDCYGRSCAPALTERVEKFLQGLGYCVVRNSPYAGGFTTRHYGNPRKHLHGLQIEINRRLYMDEVTHEKHAGYERLKGEMTALIEDLCQLLQVWRP
jgi:N-formylglutamate amidohydrolase